MSQILDSSVIVKTKKKSTGGCLLRMLTRYHSSFEHELVGGKMSQTNFLLYFQYTGNRKPKRMIW